MRMSSSTKVLDSLPLATSFILILTLFLQSCSVNTYQPKSHKDIITREQNRYQSYVERNRTKVSSALKDLRINRKATISAATPIKIAGKYYFAESEEGSTYPSIYSTNSPNSSSKKLFVNLNRVVPGNVRNLPRRIRISPDGRKVGILTQDIKQKINTLHIYDVEEDRLQTLLKQNVEQFEWLADSRRIVFTVLENYRANRFFGWDLEHYNDLVRIYAEPDKQYYLSLTKSENGKFIFLSSESLTGSELWSLAADASGYRLKSLKPRIDRQKFIPFNHSGYFYFLEKPAGRGLYRVTREKTSGSNLLIDEFYTAKSGEIIESLKVYDKFLLVRSRKLGKSRFNIYKFESRQWNVVPEVAAPSIYALEERIGGDYNNEFFHFYLHSYTSPSKLYKYDINTQGVSLLTPRSNNISYNTKELFADSGGERIPLTLILKKTDRQADSSAYILKVYGAYGESSTARFSLENKLFLDREVSIAICHVRGGGYLGEYWHRAGMQEKKPVSINDYIACAEKLKSIGAASSTKIIANGRSAGGMVALSAAMKRPDLFQAVIAEVPFLDPISTLSDETFPHRERDLQEWGNPSDQKISSIIKSYSPFYLSNPKLPKVLMTTSINDHLVNWKEPLNWAYKARSNKSNLNRIFIRISNTALHTGEIHKADHEQETAEKVAFVMDVVG